MNVLGISAYYHDSAACLVRDGALVAAAQEERFSRVKNTGEFPKHAINFCIQQQGIRFNDIHAVAFFEKPYLKFSRVLIEHLNTFPFSFRSFLRTMPEWLGDRLTLPMLIEEEIGFRGRPIFLKHHLSHAASAFLPSPFEEAAILTADGVGEWATLSTGTGRGSKIEIDREIYYPDSLGLLYTAFTVFLGFSANGDEGKTMALAGFGEPRFRAAMDQIFKMNEDGSFQLDQRYFDYRAGSRMWNQRFEELFGRPRRPEEPIEQRHYDIAASLQITLEDALLRIALLLRKETGLKNLCLAGGVALNCVANAKLLEYSGFDAIFVQPAAGDAGAAAGAALYVSNCLEGEPRSAMKHAYLGPDFSEREILQSIQTSGVAHFRKLGESELVRATAERIFANQVVGWFQGRMEFGPRALGARSILGNPCSPEMGRKINEKVKNREAFRPFAPMVLEERANAYFELKGNSPYMLLAPQAKRREAIPAAVHVDGTARVQTVDTTSHPRLRKLLLEFERISGVPVLLNTSFNRRGEPVVCSPSEAIDCFRNSGMDALVIGDFLLDKTI